MLIMEDFVLMMCCSFCCFPESEGVGLNSDLCQMLLVVSAEIEKPFTSHQKHDLALSPLVLLELPSLSVVRRIL